MSPETAAAVLAEFQETVARATHRALRQLNGLEPSPETGRHGSYDRQALEREVRLGIWQGLQDRER